MSKKYSLYIFIGALFILGISIGFFVSRFQSPSSQEAQQTEKEKTNSMLFNSQTANLRGAITAVNGTTLTVKNLNTNITGTIIASDKLKIIKPGSKPQSATSSAALSALELNKEVLITTEMINGDYQAVTIQYTLPPPSLPPIPASSKPPAPKPPAQ